MTAMLSPRVAYDPHETSLSWAGRLAAVHTGQPLQRLLADMSVPVSAFLASEPGAVTGLAEVAGEDPERVQDGAFRLLNRYNMFRGEDCQRGFASPRVRQFCPLCVRADGNGSAWKHRILWCFSAVSICPEHSVGLASAPSDADLVDIRDAVEAMGGLRRAEATLQDQPVRDHVKWIASRLDGTARDGDWLGAQTIAQVIEASDTSGLRL